MTEQQIKPMTQWALARFANAYMKQAGVTAEELAVDIEGITGAAVEKFVKQSGTAAMRNVFARWAKELGYPDNPVSLEVAKAASFALERDIEFIPTTAPRRSVSIVTDRRTKIKPERPTLTDRFLAKAEELGLDVSDEPTAMVSAQERDPLKVPYSADDRDWLEGLTASTAAAIEEPDAEPQPDIEIVTHPAIGFAPQPTSDSPAWPPAGFTLLEPLPRSLAARQLALYVKDDRAMINAALARELDRPEAVQLAIDATGERIVFRVVDANHPMAVRIGRKNGIERSQLPLLKSARRGVFTVTADGGQWLATWSGHHG